MRRRCASIEEMASNVRCARRLRPLWRWASSSSTAAARPKFYKEKPKYYKEVAQTYAKFRREVSGLRKEFRRQWTEQQRMTQTQFSAKAAEEARQKEMEETRAFEAAARELERMARERESAMQREEERVKEKREKGAIARQQWEEQLLESVARKNEAAEVARRDRITTENMDKKISEALENEFLEDFILSPATGEVKIIKYEDIQ